VFGHGEYKAEGKVYCVNSLGLITAPLSYRVFVWLVVIIACGAGCNGRSPTSPSTLTLQCPADVTEKSRAGESVPVAYQPPQAQGGTPPVSVSCSPSLPAFPPGETGITCTATDSTGQRAMCAFKVNIVRVPRIALTSFVAFGDSITYGTTSPAGLLGVLGPPESYPFKLHALLSQRYEDQTITLTNAGQPGEGVAAGAQRLPGLLASLKPDALLLLEGANDLLGRGAAAIPDILAALRADVREARNRSVRPFLATFPPQRPNTQRGVSAALVPGLNDQIRALAAAEGVTLVDLYAAFPADTFGYIGVDGLHPTEQGYTVMADAFFQAIRGSLEVTTPSLYMTGSSVLRFYCSKVRGGVLNRETHHS